MTANLRTGLALLALAALALAVLASAVMADDKPVFKGCFLEGSASGQLLHDDRKAVGGLGLGCDVAISKVILGAVLRGDMGETKSGEIAGRVGFALNPHLMLYGVGAWVAQDYEFAENGAWFMGLGAETTALVDQLSIGIEGTHAVSKFGSEAFDVDDSRIRMYGRYRLPVGR